VIDVHCHVLPYLDDGARDWEASLAMLRDAAEDGITQVIATPHWTGTPGEMEKLSETLGELRRRLDAAGLKIKLHAGNEVVLVPRLVESLREKQALTLAGSTYVLLETAQLEQGAYTLNALFQLQASGFRVILAHPERVQSWHGYPGEVRDLLQRGCYLQVNGMSLLGGFGKPAKKAAEEYLKRGWVSLLASDAHSPTTRPQLLTPALRRSAALIGEDAARALVDANPARVLCNEQLPYIDLDAPPRNGFFSFPWWPRR
jgi:protein-tyrosine phosphatase